MKNLILGVDPGLSGAIAFYNLETKNLNAVIDLPILSETTASTGRIHRRVDARKLTDTLLPFKLSGRIAGAMIEEVGAAPHQGLSSTFNFGYSAGILEGVLSALGIEINFIKPAVWKLSYGLSRDKEESRIMAIRLFTANAMNGSFALKKHDGRAEAALIAKFGERIYRI